MHQQLWSTSRGDVGSPLEETVSTSHNLRSAVRARMSETGESYTEALRAITAERFISREILDDATPPAPWKVRLRFDQPEWQHPEPLDHWTGVIAVLRNCDGAGKLDQVVAFDRESGARLAEVKLPHVPTETLLAGYRNQLEQYPGSPNSIELTELVTRGRPDLMAHRLGFEIVNHTCDWQEWSDGSQRIPAMPIRRRHSATATSLGRDEGGPAVHLVVLEHPDTVVLDVVVPGSKMKRDGTSHDRMLNVLAEHGWVIDHDLWYELTAGSFYALARPGILAEKSWYRKARVQITRQVQAHSPEGPPATFRAGEELEMVQWGRAGQSVDDEKWWTSTDLDGAKILDSKDLEVLEILEDRPPTWSRAALSVATVTRLLAPHHAGAAQAAQAWADAGLHVSRGPVALEIRTPAPKRRLIGQVKRDYWNQDRHTGRYEVVVHEGEYSYDTKTVKLEQLPLDPMAALAQAEQQQPVKS
jgi:hypothetical protein